MGNYIYKPVQQGPYKLTLTILLLAAVVLLNACDSEVTSPDLSDPVLQSRSHDAVSAQSNNFSPVINKEIATVRRSTARYQRYDTALADGFVRLSECVEIEGVGGMGYHYGHPGRINGNVEVENPEVLMYLPDRNGNMHLIGVEYIIPFDFLGADEDPPILFDREFSPNPVLELWALHVWVWKHNPNGIFEDWNPKVSCQFAVGES
jgi:hypothetical protein